MIPGVDTFRAHSGLVVLILASLGCSVAPAVAAADAAADTVRTNLWLTEALMAEVGTAVMRVLPAPPRVILLEARSDADEDELYGTVATRQLLAAGYEVRVPVDEKAAADSTATPTRDAVPPPEVTYGFLVNDVDLSYPEVGRTLGVWRQWVDRELSVSVLVSVQETASGRVLLNERITRSFGDRVPDGDFGDVNSDVYGFTSAETSESAWQRRMEEIVVLGALAGLVAIYFANTSN